LKKFIKNQPLALIEYAPVAIFLGAGAFLAAG
jgi:hypothetical protein